MKIVFTEKARHEFDALRRLSQCSDACAGELLTRMSFIVADMMQKQGINDSELGKIEHYPGVEKGYLGGNLSGCIVRNIDSANRLVACEINGVSVILSCMGHYNDPMLHPKPLKAVMDDLIELAKEKPQILCDLEESSSDIIESVMYTSNGVIVDDKESYDEFVAEFNKKTKGRIGRIFPTDPSSVERMISNSHKGKDPFETITNVIKEDYFRTITNAVNYSICYALEESGDDLRLLLKNKQKYDRIIQTSMYNTALGIRDCKSDDDDKKKKEDAIKQVLQGYAMAYAAHITFTDKGKAKRYPDDLIFMDRFNNKLTEIVNNDVSVSISVYEKDTDSIDLTDIFNYENAISSKKIKGEKEGHRVNFSGIAKILGLNFDGTDPDVLYNDLNELKISRLTIDEVKKIRLQLELEKQEQKSQERIMEQQRLQAKQKGACKGRCL